MKSKVIWYNRTKGFGFAENIEAEKDVFIHRSQVPEGTDLYEGDWVSFDLEENDKGFVAKNIKKLEE